MKIFGLLPGVFQNKTCDQPYEYYVFSYRNTRLTSQARKIVGRALEMLDLQESIVPFEHVETP